MRHRTTLTATSAAFAVLAPAAPLGAPAADDQRQYGSFLTDSRSGGAADHTFHFGRLTDEVYVGDWDGDGDDTFAVRRGARFHVTNHLSGGPAQVEFSYGRADDEVLVGDWDGDGDDTIGVRRGTAFHLKTPLTGAPAER